MEVEGNRWPASASLPRRVVVEGVGTAFLLSTVVGSGIMGERLFGGNAGLTLLANSLATGAGLAALITAFGPVSGAQLNPLVTLADAVFGRRPWREVFPYALAQVVGALAGVAVAHLMFGDPLFSASRRVRAGAPQALGECVATFGLLAVIFLPLPTATEVDGARGRLVHRGGLLVHLIDRVRQPRRHAGAVGDRHLHRDPAGGCTWLLGRPGRRHARLSGARTVAHRARSIQRQEVAECYHRHSTEGGGVRRNRRPHGRPMTPTMVAESHGSPLSALPRAPARE